MFVKLGKTFLVVSFDPIAYTFLTSNNEFDRHHETTTDGI